MNISSSIGIECPNDRVLQEDIERAARYDSAFAQLDGKTVLITGATGLLGSITAQTLACRNRLYGASIRILALVRSVEKARRVFGTLLDDGRIVPMQGDVLALPEIDEDIDYILHGASVTGSRDFVESPVDTIRTALKGTANMLELAKNKQVSGFLYLSSLEVYGVTNPALPYVSESDYGLIDPLSVRSSYSEGKRMAENLCVAYNKQYNVPTRIVRLAQTFGAGVDYNDGRVFAMLARSVVEKKDIILRTKGDTLRNYCYTTDAVTALLTVMTCGANAVAYNIANRETGISIRDLAQRLCDNYPETGIRVVFDLSQDVTALGFNPTVVIRLDTQRLEQLGWQPFIGLDEMFDRTIRSFRERTQHGQ